jgi:hypothetical protein
MEQKVNDLSCVIIGGLEIEAVYFKRTRDDLYLVFQNDLTYII